MAYAVQISNPTVVQKIETLARAMNLGKTALIDRALDLLNTQVKQSSTLDDAARSEAYNEFRTIVARMHSIPDLPNTSHITDLDWDENGLPI